MKYVSGWTNVLSQIVFNSQTCAEGIIRGKGEVVLCLIRHYAMKLYKEIIAACILIILTMHEGQWACFYPPSPQMLYARERAPIAYWVGRGWAPVSLHIGEKRENLPMLGTEK